MTTGEAIWLITGIVVLKKLLIHKGLEYVNAKDESGFRKFLVDNKDSFFIGILSNLVSTGLLPLLNQWCK